MLITPVPPGRFAGPVKPLVVDPDAFWSVPPEALDAMFWDAVEPDTARRYRALFTPESPRAVLEAARWLLDPDVSGITAPALVFGAGADELCPEPGVRALARALGAEYVYLEGEGHGVPQNPVSARVADRIGEWLGGVFPAAGGGDA